MEIKVEEISAQIKKSIYGFEEKIDVSEIGTVLSVGDYIARVYGLEKAMSSELLQFPNDVYGMALNLEDETIGSVLFGESQLVHEGDIVKRTGRIMN
ncbi:ATP synthase F1, alpha subunit, partial [Candidatus Magnetomorum sp. HK-1]